MPSRFRQTDTMDSQVGKARELGLLFLDRELGGASKPEDIADFITAFLALIGKAPGRNDFRHDRIDRAGRRALGLSRRRYAKMFRLAKRMEAKYPRMVEALRRAELTSISKSRLVLFIDDADLRRSRPTAAFVAYLTARLNLRSEFTIAGQQRPFDSFAAELLRRCERDRTTNWFAIAHVFPRDDVLARLSDEQRGLLLERSSRLLDELAERLERIASTTEVDLATMIVRRGNDSSSWNMLAGAWNRARDHWMALIVAMGLESLFDSMLPGKVMKLMAADVAAWHRSAGGGIHGDTAVWAALPKPWDVLRGEAKATRAGVEAVCRAHGVDPEKNGWTLPPAMRTVARARPTPELVHGVAVGNPYVAGLFKRAGVFSGRPVKWAELNAPGD